MNDKKGIIFDVGSVIIKTNWKAAAKVIGVTKEDYCQAFFKNREEYLDSYEKGEKGIKNFGDFVVNNLSLNGSYCTINRFSRSIKAIWEKPDPEMIDLIARIKPQMKKAILSNSWPELEEKARELECTEDAFMRLFEHVFFSHRIGARKPERKAYEIAVNGMGLDCSQCIFVDDRKENVKAAERLGITGIIYRNPKELEKILNPYLLKI